jgi:hypothetical protein
MQVLHLVRNWSVQDVLDALWNCKKWQGGVHAQWQQIIQMLQKILQPTSDVSEINLQ